MPDIPDLEIKTPTGTVWDGEAQSILWRGENFGQVIWRFQPKKLFQGKANYHLKFGRQSDMKLIGKGDVGIGMSGLYAENVVASIPATQVVQRMSVPVPLKVNGNIELSIDEYYHADPWCRFAEGNLVWSEGKVTSPIGALDLGVVVTDLSCQDNRLSLVGEQNNNQVSSAITAELQSNMRYDVNAWFKPNKDFPKAMNAQLKWLGSPNNQGEYPFTFAGKLN